MNECKYSTAILIEYLERREKDAATPMPPELANHIKNCQVCAHLINSEQMARAFIKLFRSRQKSGKRQTGTAKHASAIAPGQIWRFFFGSDKQSEFCLITSSPFSANKKLSDAVRVAPLYLAPNPEETADTDIIISAENTVLGVPTLIEYWNERPILCRQLMEYAGAIDGAVLERVRQNLLSEREQTMNRRVKMFRQHEIARGSLFSEPVFDELKADEPDIIPDTEWYKNGIKLIYRRLKSLIESAHLTDHREKICFSVTEESQMIYAAAIIPPGENLKRLYQLLCDFVLANADLPLRIRLMPDNSLKIINITKQNFLLNFLSYGNAIYSVTSINGLCHIKVSDPTAKLNLNELVSITFEEI